jgi:hypothetical protein
MGLDGDPGSPAPAGHRRGRSIWAPVVFAGNFSRLSEPTKPLVPQECTDEEASLFEG